MNLFVTPAQLDQAKVNLLLASNENPSIFQETVVKYRKGELNHLSEDEIWAAKHLYDSAFHPDTGDI